jgi:hypothetical protein
MARRRHENGLKYQQRVESERLKDRRPEPPPAAPVPPGVTQMFETATPPAFAPHDSHAPNDPHAPHDPHDP